MTVELFSSTFVGLETRTYHAAAASQRETRKILPTELCRLSYCKAKLVEGDTWQSKFLNMPFQYNLSKTDPQN